MPLPPAINTGANTGPTLSLSRPVRDGDALVQLHSPTSSSPTDGAPSLSRKGPASKEDSLSSNTLSVVASPSPHIPKDHANNANTGQSSAPTSLITQVDESAADQPKRNIKHLQIPASAKIQQQQQVQNNQQLQQQLQPNHAPQQNAPGARRPPGGGPPWKRFLFGCCGFNPRDDDGGYNAGGGASVATIQTGAASTATAAFSTGTVTAGQDTAMKKNPSAGKDRVVIVKSAQYALTPNGQPYLLPLLDPQDVGKKCLVLDLDETLVHSSFKAVPTADFVIPIEIDNQLHNVYVLKRPGVDTFMQMMGQQYEIVVFTASLSKYADPVLDMLDKHRVVKHRLFREACLHHKGNYVKDLNQLGRDIKDVIILDNSPVSYIFHPANAIPISSWFNDPNDTELLDLIPFLEELKAVDDVTAVLNQEAG
ncbi:hypothetical protein CcCBS67573_g03363 [Chytriomyces confervae]|uniref:protein-serine/threonine phosphatase n=1 Tax=Chytriomyces confervae TaxID=246404 RepID=A0A507FG88_9FUNG|nr:hypothetical protein HDU80_008900 [Chytriomyces hyalinus]TPX75381.1 hypothetical protein CcCBS67573_g03363 [Chytriomyces confervae]